MAGVRLLERGTVLVRLSIVLLILVAGGAGAQVTAVSERGFVSEHRILLDASVEEAFAALTSGIHLWWDGDHSYSGDAGNFYLEAKANGCFCEKLAGGGSVMHMQVAFVEPGRRLRLLGGLGPLQGMGVSGSMDFALEPAENGTVLRYRYVVHGYAPEGLEALAGPVDSVQLGQLQRLAAYLEKN